jgi:NAD(P)H-dependent FMN reductase
MSRIAIVTGSTRPGRHSEAVAKWVLDNAQRRDDAQFDLVDIADYGLAQLDEMMPASMGAYSQPHTHRWADTIASFDGFIFVTPEYNHSTSGALKNAIDFLYAEWNNKAAGFVSYGAAGGTRAVEHLRLIMAELQIADVRAQVALSLMADFTNFTEFTPQDHHVEALTPLFDQVVSWSTALAGIRS